MLNFYKIIETLVSIQLLILSTMIPVYIPIPFIQKTSNNFEMPISWQIPTVIVLTLIFNKKVVFRAFTIYLIIGLFVAPIFHQGGLVGYLLTPNFGYLLGTYPLIKIIDNLNKKNKINIFDFLKNGFLSILVLHIIGILYSFIQMILYSKFNIFLYNIGQYSVGKIGYHLLMLMPIIILIKPIKYFKNIK